MEKSDLTQHDGPQDPERCDIPTCRFKRIEGSLKCPVHGSAALGKQELDRKRIYKLTKFKHQLEDKLSSNEVLGLREELALCRIVLENIFEQTDSSNELVTYSSQIATFMQRIESIVHSIHKLERSMGHLLEKTQVMRIATDIIDTVTDVFSQSSLSPEELTERLELVATSILEGVLDAGTIEDKNS